MRFGVIAFGLKPRLPGEFATLPRTSRAACFYLSDLPTIHFIWVASEWPTTRKTRERLDLGIGACECRSG
jgi:hypothetical protein